MPRINKFKRSRSIEELSIDYNELAGDQFRGITLPEIMNRTFTGKVWHAFTALPRNTQGLLDLSKAKVLAQSIASVMKVASDVINDFEMFFSDQYNNGIEFDVFQDFINLHVITKINAPSDDIEPSDDFEICNENEEVGEQEPIAEEFSKAKKKPSIPKDADSPAAGAAGQADNGTSISWELLDQVCWTIYSKQALSPRYYEQFSDETLFSLWLWFITYSDTLASGVVACPVVMDCDELNYWLTYLFDDLLALDFKPLEFSKSFSLSFTEALDAIISTKDQWNIDKDEIEFVIQEFRLEMIDGIIRKGFLYKGKRNLMKPQWKRRYCVLTLKTFTYYADESMTDRKGLIPLSKIMSADPYRDRNSKLTRYQLETHTALFILEAEDLRSRNQWIRDIRFALRCNMRMVENVHIIKAEKRKTVRAERRLKEQLDEEEKQKISQRIQEAEEVNENLSKEIQNVKSELEREEQQRLSELKAREQITMDLQSRLENISSEMYQSMERTEREKEQQQQELENERNRVLELQAMKNELEAALQEEKQLRKDEETVMKMQAELVEEQVKARERLEEIKTEQEELLGMEIQKRSNIQVELENQKETIARSEHILNQYEQQLKDSETQKNDLYKKMKELEEKLKKNSTFSFKIGSHRGKGAFPESLAQTKSM